MVNKNKKIISRSAQIQKSVSGQQYTTDNMKSVWYFDMLDRDGPFAFDLLRRDFNHKEFLSKMIDYSNMTWSEIKQQTHDQGKSKHHFLEMSTLSRDAQKRIECRKLSQYADSIFSFALQNKLRIIGIRKDDQFHVVWYDPEHKFCPVKK